MGWFKSGLLTCLFALPALLGAGHSAFAKPDVTGLSAEWLTFLYYDWSFNNSNREDEIIDVDRLKDRDVIILARDSLRDYSSYVSHAPLTNPLAPAALISNGGPLLFVDDGTRHYRDIWQGLPTIPNTLRAVKLQSHSTYLVWDREHPELTPFFVKLSGEYLPPQMTDVLMGLLGNTSDPELDFMPESLSLVGFNPKNLLGTWATYRSGLSAFHKPGDHLPLPAHGFLNHEHGKQFEEWKIAQFAPMFGRVQARLNHKYGIFHASHTQNILLRFGEGDLDLRSIVLRDMWDTFVDPLVALENKYLAPEYLNHRFMQDRGFCKGFDKDRKNSMAGHFLYNYALQSIAHIFDGKPLYTVRGIAAFLNSYLVETKKSTGKKIKLSPHAEETLALFNEDFSRTRQIEGRLNALGIEMDEADVVTRLQKAAALVLQDIYEKIRRAQLPDILPAPSFFDQEKLAWLSLKLLGEGKTAFFTASMYDKFSNKVSVMSKRYRFSYGDGRLYLFAADGKTLLAMFYTAGTPADVSLGEASRLSTCTRILKKAS